MAKCVTHRNKGRSPGEVLLPDPFCMEFARSPCLSHSPKYVAKLSEVKLY